MKSRSAAISQQLFADSAPVKERANYLRFRLSPSSVVALAARVKRFGAEFVGDQRELYLIDEQPAAETPCVPRRRDALELRCKAVSSDRLNVAVHPRL